MVEIITAPAVRGRGRWASTISYLSTLIRTRRFEFDDQFITRIRSLRFKRSKYSLSHRLKMYKRRDDTNIIYVLGL